MDTQDIIKLIEFFRNSRNINVNLKMYTFDYLRMYKYDHINLCYKWDRCGLFVYSDILNNLASCFIQIFN